MFDSIFSEPRGTLDRLQVASVACLMILGVLFVYSATMVTESAMAAPLYTQLWVRQIVWYVLGIVSTHGCVALRWIDIGPYQGQPSEFAKLAFILAQASFLSRPPEELASPLNFLKSIGLMILPFLLILKEPDLGSALVLLPTGLAIMFAAGIPKKYLVWLGAGVGVLAALFLVDVLFAPPGWSQIKLEDYQRQRLLVYIG